MGMGALAWNTEHHRHTQNIGFRSFARVLLGGRMAGRRQNMFMLTARTEEYWM